MLPDHADRDVHHPYRHVLYPVTRSVVLIHQTKTTKR